MADAQMQFLCESAGRRWYFAEPGRFARPGLYFWGGESNVHIDDALAAEAAAPIDMVLHCPKCHVQHIDAQETLNAGPDERGRRTPTAITWSNPPHRSHLCHGCGHIWRPADVPTNGVLAVSTAGKNDSPAVGATVPNGEVVAWMTHHDEPMFFPTRKEASAYCEEDEEPIPLCAAQPPVEQGHLDVGTLGQLSDGPSTLTGANHGTR